MAEDLAQGTGPSGSGDEVDRHGLTDRDRSLLFLASFLSLMAAGIGFAFRAMVPHLWAAEYNVLDAEVGKLFGAGLWPIAVMMILFSLIVDKVGYKRSMICAFVLQAVSVVLTFVAGSFNAMWWACIFAGLGHGVVEATINPLVASVYRHEKTKWLAILHAAWPAGLAVGAAIYMTVFKNAQTWNAAKAVWFIMLLPVIGYGIMYLMCKRFPVDERVEAKVPYTEMLRELGGLGAFLALSFIGYEIYTQLGLFSGGQYTRLLAALGIGAAGGLLFGIVVKSAGRWLFFFLCVLMVPLATAELATDGWIQNLMKPTLGEYARWALVLSATIMMALRFFAGVPLKFTGPLGLLLISSVFSIIGLFALSVASGVMIFVAFVFYAVGQTFYWPAVLGFTSEQYPKGGALTLNTVSAMGLLTVGIFGFPFLGAVQDNYNAKAVMEEHPSIVEVVRAEQRTTVMKGAEEQIVQDKVLFGISYPAINTDAIMAQPEFPADSKEALKERLKNSGRRTLRVASVLPITMAIGFFLILMWFKSHGGYKPVQLVDD
ncbi:MAG: MFS transporter [Lentisphaerae bacterium]|nr:MFS transporter [Lentisphaerota bacterium]